MKAVSSRSWQSLLRGNDAAKLWHSLNHLVSIHPLIRAAKRNPAKGVLATCTLPDITQDLYLQLLQKSRFQHYVDNNMTDSEIEREIYQVELTNMLVGRLRQRHPESYRLARRISSIVESGVEFKSFTSRQAKFRYASGVVYGLASWPENLKARLEGNFERMIADIPVRTRDLRRAGCTGETQVIITNQELSELIVDILRAVGSPLSLKCIRKLALTKLPVIDVAVSSIDQLFDYEDGPAERDWMLATNAGCPEKHQLEQEDRCFATKAVKELFSRIERLARFRPAQTETLYRILWHFYFDPSQPSQLAIARTVGLSDSSVSCYRQKMEGEIRKLLSQEFTDTRFAFFAEAMAAELSKRISAAEKSARQKSERMTEASLWSLGFGQLARFENRPAL